MPRLVERAEIPDGEPADLDWLWEIQAGVATTAQLDARGVSPARIRARVDAGRWRRSYPRVVINHCGPMPYVARAWAGVLWAGSAAMLSHDTAGFLARMGRRPDPALCGGDSGRARAPAARVERRADAVRVAMPAECSNAEPSESWRGSGNARAPRVRRTRERADVGRLALVDQVTEAPAGVATGGVGAAAGKESPIGVFDSGVGGLTVARSILDLLPHEPVYYVADTAHFPYGPKSIAEVRQYALAVLDQMVDHGVKMLVIACNSASSAMLRDARERYAVPVVEVIQPAVRKAVSATRNGKVGVIGTYATVTSMAYDDAFAAAPQIDLTTAACPRFVEFVEAGVTMSDELLGCAKEYLAPIVERGCDTLVLGCTHYPFLAGAISLVVGDEVMLVSSADETARDVYRTLVRHGLSRSEDSAAPEHRFVATGDRDAFLRLGRRFLGPEIRSVERV
jgi:glutamate racemase